MFFEQFMHGQAQPANTTKFYDLLGVKKSDDETTIKKAFRRLALQHHPDRGGNADTFKELNRAYEVLSDKDKRAIYDQGGEEALSHAQEGASNGHHHMPFNMFNMFGDFGHPNPGARSRTSKSTTMNMSVPLEQLFTGATKTLSVRRSVSCATCHGKGTKSGKDTQCRPCHGLGIRQQIRQIGPGMIQQVQVDCTDCKGTGLCMVDDADKCASCNGSRTVEEKTQITLDIEKGMKHGEQIVFKGQGGSEPGQPASDIVIVLEQTPHQTFQRKGNHLVMERSITLLEALSGFKFQLNHLGGRILQVCSAPNMVTKPGDVQRVRGEGMPVRGGMHRGDLLIRFDVVFPMHAQLTPATVALLEQALPKPQPTPTPATGVQVTTVHTEAVIGESATRHSDDAMDDDDAEQQQSSGAPQCRQS